LPNPSPAPAGGIARHSSTASGAAANDGRFNYRGIGFSVRRKITTACSSTIANMGDMSSPPIGGMSRRNGRRIGSEMVVSKAVMGL
jgi:hypothetical protein